MHTLSAGLTAFTVLILHRLELVTLATYDGSMLNRKGKRASRPPSLARFKRLTRYDGDPLKQAHAFTFFVHLPGELQEHILSFLPVRVLARDVLPVDRRCKQLVDALIQRRLGLYLSAEGAQTGRGGEGKGFVVRGRGERQSRREKSALIVSDKSVAN